MLFYYNRNPQSHRVIPLVVKPEIGLQQIVLLDGDPVVGKPVRFSAIFPDGVCRITTTSNVVNWWQGYPYGPQDIRIETKNRIYFGPCNRPLR